MDDLFLRNETYLRKMFTYMCSQCTAPEDPISNMACQFLHGKLHISFGVSGIAFFEDGIIYPYFFMTREQRQYLYSIAGAIASESHDSPQKYRFCNGCLVLTDYTGKSFDSKLVWRVIMQCVATSSKHRDCLRMLADVVVQRILCKTQHSKDVRSYVHELADEVFGVKKNPA